MAVTFGQYMIADTAAELTNTNGINGYVAFAKDTKLLYAHNGTSWSLLIPPIGVKNTNYTLTATDYTIQFDCSTGNLTANLPTAVGVSGRVYVLKKIDASANTLTIDGNGSETIQALGAPATTQVLSGQGSALTVQSDGNNWTAY